ncbi:MAG: hypothetical protein HZA54_04360 [Planctomycetes bacterium]|nr:hypothetical protein [Planctomycetota bacterium]
MELPRPLAEARDLVLRMNGAQRTSLVAALVVLFGCGSMLVAWGASDGLTPFLLSAPPDLIYTVVKRLEAKGVRHQVQGNVLLVPAEQKERLLLDLTGEGVLPEGTDLFRWVYEQDLTESASRRDLKYQRSLIRRLESMIGALDGVSAVKVEMVQPPESPFLGAKSAGKASVLVKLKPGFSLSKENTLGIAKIVAVGNGVPPENVSIVDTAGRCYRVPAERDLAATSSEQLELKRAFERQEEEKLTDHLSFLRHKIVTVDATLDFQSLRRSIHDVDPTRTVEVMEHERTEREGSATPAGASAAANPDGTAATDDGALGLSLGGRPSAGPGLGIATGPFNAFDPEPAAPGSAAAAALRPAGLAGAGSQKSDLEVRRETTRTETTLEIPPGSIKEMSVAVLVDKEELTQAGMTAEGLRDHLLGATRVAAPEQLKVSAISFAAPPALPEPSTTDRLESAVQRWAGPFVLSALLLASAFMLVRSLRTAAPGEVAEDIARVRREFAREEEADPGAPLPRRLEQVRRMAQESPRVAAAVISRWLEPAE